MKIQKINQIKNVGKFENYSAKGDVAFTDFTLIFGENGKGKTTLCTILRSLKSGSVALLAEKKRVGASVPIDVDILLEDKIHAQFIETSNKWTRKNPEIEIFDSYHVNNNVYSGDHVDHSHKKNLYYLVIGDTGVNLAQEIEQIDADIKASTEQLRLKESEIKGNIRSKCRVEEFINRPVDQDVDKKLEETDREIRAIEEADKIQKNAYLSTIVLPELLLEELNNILNSSLESVSREAESNVRAQCTSLGEYSESWLKKGVDLLEKNSSEKCPFCGQDINQLGLIHYYQDFFSQAYTELKDQIAAFYQKFEGNFSSRKVIDIQSQLSTNSSLLDKWQIYITTPEIFFDFEKVIKIRETIMEIVRALIDQKTQSPLDVIQFSPELLGQVDQLNKAKTEIDTYNAKITLVNEQIKAKKAGTQTGNLIVEQSKRLELLDIQTRYSSEVNKLCEEYNELYEKITSLRSKKQNKSVELKNYSEDVLNKYQATINDYLSKFGTEFEIVDPKTSLQGGKPSANYMLKVNGIAVPLGTTETEGEPCFRTILSDGDKNSLAFALFMAQLKLDPDIENKTIIIDDPITSLDANRKKRTFQEIREIARLAKQTIILSHDAYFLKLFWDEIPNTKTLQIKRNGQQSIICEWDIDKETLPSFMRDYSRLEDFLSKGEDDLLGVARCIRPVLEGYLRVRCPSSFGPKEWLGDFLAKIRNADSSDTVFKLKPFLEELSHINDYSKQFHHQKDPLINGFEISDTELHTYVYKTIELLKKM